MEIESTPEDIFGSLKPQNKNNHEPKKCYVSYTRI